MKSMLVGIWNSTNGMGKNLAVSYKVDHIHTLALTNAFLGTVSFALVLVLKMQISCTA